MDAAHGSSPLRLNIALTVKYSVNDAPAKTNCDDLFCADGELNRLAGGSCRECETLQLCASRYHTWAAVLSRLLSSGGAGTKLHTMPRACDMKPAAVFSSLPEFHNDNGTTLSHLSPDLDFLVGANIYVEPSHCQSHHHSPANHHHSWDFDVAFVAFLRRVIPFKLRLHPSLREAMCTAQCMSSDTPFRPFRVNLTGLDSLSTSGALQFIGSAQCLVATPTMPSSQDLVCQALIDGFPEAVVTHLFSHFPNICHDDCDACEDPYDTDGRGDLRKRLQWFPSDSLTVDAQLAHLGKIQQALCCCGSSSSTQCFVEEVLNRIRSSAQATTWFLVRYPDGIPAVVLKYHHSVLQRCHPEWFDPVLLEDDEHHRRMVSTLLYQECRWCFLLPEHLLARAVTDTITGETPPHIRPALLCFEEHLSGCLRKMMEHSSQRTTVQIRDGTVVDISLRDEAAVTATSNGKEEEELVHVSLPIPRERSAVASTVIAGDTSGHEINAPEPPSRRKRCRKGTKAQETL